MLQVTACKTSSQALGLLRAGVEGKPTLVLQAHEPTTHNCKATRLLKAMRRSQLLDVAPVVGRSCRTAAGVNFFHLRNFVSYNRRRKRRRNSQCCNCFFTNSVFHHRRPRHHHGTSAPGCCGLPHQASALSGATAHLEGSLHAPEGELAL